MERKVPAHLIQRHFNTDAEKTITPSPWSHTFPLTLPATPLWRFGRCTTNILVQHSQRRKATVTKQQSLGGGQSYRHGDPHSFGLSFFRRSRPSRALTAGERRHQHSTSINHTESATLDTFTLPKPPHASKPASDLVSDFCWQKSMWWERNVARRCTITEARTWQMQQWMGKKGFWIWVLKYTKCFQK